MDKGKLPALGKRGQERLNYDKKCKWHKSCGYDFCHGEGICPEFEKGKPPKETEKESEVKHDGITTTLHSQKGDD